MIPQVANFEKDLIKTCSFYGAMEGTALLTNFLMNFREKIGLFDCHPMSSNLEKPPQKIDGYLNISFDSNHDLIGQIKT